MNNDDDFSPSSIFDGSPALEVYQNVSEEKTPEGLSLERQCERCLKRLGILIPWSELYVVANSRWPQQYRMSVWKRSERYRKMFPDVYCRCGTLALVGFTPSEAQAICSKALTAGIIDDTQMRQIDQLKALFKAGK